MSDVNVASGNLSSNKIGSDNSVVKIEKPSLFNKENITNYITNNITNNLAITTEDREKIVNDLLLSNKLKELIIKEIQNLDTGAKKIFIDSNIALASSSKEDYEDKTKLLQNILIKKLENIDDNRIHYLTLQSIEALKNISSDEMKLLAIMVFFLGLELEHKMSRAWIEFSINNFINIIGLDDFMDKIFSYQYSKPYLHSLHTSRLTIYGHASGNFGAIRFLNILFNCFSCDTEEQLKAKINNKFILLVRHTQELTELGVFLGKQILSGMGVPFIP